jgi:hypothetical protein
MQPNGTVGAIIERQWLHLLALGIALPVLWMMSTSCGCFHHGEFLGISTWSWFWISVEVPIAHQIYVWLCWRFELHRGLLTRWFGDFAFPFYSAIFTVFLVGRLIVITALSVSSAHTIPANDFLLKILACTVAVPVTYLGYSVLRYFGILRAYGLDHFDESNRNRPLVCEGIFRLTANGMYVFGLMALYIPAFWWASRPATVATVFSHLSIWVHCLATELPDMRRLYRDQPTS